MPTLLLEKLPAAPVSLFDKPHPLLKQHPLLDKSYVTPTQRTCTYITKRFVCPEVLIAKVASSEPSPLLRTVELRTVEIHEETEDMLEAFMPSVSEHLFSKLLPSPASAIEFFREFSVPLQMTEFG